LTFEEYLASRALMESEYVDRDRWLREKWPDERWKEEEQWLRKKIDTNWFEDAVPQHQIMLPVFQIGKYPVTNGRFREFVKDHGYKNPQWWNFSPEAEAFHKDLQEKFPRYWHDPRWNGDNAPVVGVSWYAATAFCNWLTRRWCEEGKIGATETIRLPTEAEWEKAASWDGQNKTKRRFPWGEEYDVNLANADGQTRGFGNSFGVTN
jgi:formylglycine-generating enzyme required for sulfatase activity